MEINRGPTRDRSIQKKTTRNERKESQLSLPGLNRRPARLIQLLILVAVEPVQLVFLTTARIPALLDQVALELLERSVHSNPRSCD